MQGKQTGERSGPSWTPKVIQVFVTLVLVSGVFILGYQFGTGGISLPGHKTAAGSLPASLDYSSVNTVYNSLKENYNGKLTESQLTDGLKHGLAEATNDPYTTFFTAAEAKSFDSTLNNTFSGIGAQLGKDDAGNIQVIAPIDGFPAAKAGIKAKDLIATIDGKSTGGLSVDAAVKAIRGKAGSSVKLQIVRADQPLDFTITRENIQIPSVTTKTLDNNIGYIQISSFSSDTSKLVDDVASKFAAAKVKGIVLDLRNDPGGEVDAAVSASSQWLPAGTSIMQEKKASGEVLDSYQSDGTNLLHDIPTVVLINGGSASASEITAAALHDNKQAYIIGEKSYGKGVVQQIVNFNDGSELKVTVASWYRPNGQNINHKGIEPDQEVVLSDADAKAGNDVQLTAAETYLNK